MNRRNRRPDWRRVKALQSYTIEEAATLLGVHRNTVRHWIKKQGLPVFDDQRPHLLQGAELVTFLKNRRAARRRKCSRGQIYCVKCREPRAPADEMVDYQAVTSEQGILLGICPTCDRIMHSFISKAQWDAMSSTPKSKSRTAKND